jgi:hypothetical protein
LNKPEITHIKKKECLNTIFCLSDKESHYIYRDIHGTAHDPYNYFQIDHSHGNCFLYALYLAHAHNTPNHQKILLNVYKTIRPSSSKSSSSSSSSKSSSTNTRKSKRVKPVKKKEPSHNELISNNPQLAYQCFVYNDFTVINWGIKLINDNYSQLHMTTTWNQLTTIEFKKEKGFPQAPLTLKLFMNKFNQLASSIAETYQMTRDTWKFAMEESVLPNDLVYDESNYEFADIPIAHRMG